MRKWSAFLIAALVLFMVTAIYLFKRPLPTEIFSIRFIDELTGEPVENATVTAQEHNFVQDLLEELGFAASSPAQHQYTCTNGCIGQFKLSKTKATETTIMCSSDRYELAVFVYSEGKWLGSSRLQQLASSIASNSPVLFPSNGTLTIKLYPEPDPDRLIRRKPKTPNQK